MLDNCVLVYPRTCGYSSNVYKCSKPGATTYKDFYVFLPQNTAQKNGRKKLKPQYTIVM